MSRLARIANAAKSLYCWIASFAWMIGATTLALPVVLLVGPERGHWLALRPALAWVIPICLIRVRVHRHPEFDPAARGVLIQNHVSVLDGSLATLTVPHRFCGLFNSWHFWLPGYGWIMYLSKGIGVSSSREGRAAALGEAVRNRVEQHGISVLVFPEGHRTRDGKVRPFRRGGFFMARDAGVPIIPVFQRGMYELQNKLSWRFHSPGMVDVYFGRPIPTAGLSDEEVGELTEECQRLAETWVETGEMPQR